MNAPKFVLHFIDDEHREYSVNGEIIAKVNYDNHGLAGMELADRMFFNIAEKLGVEVEKFEGRYSKG